MGSYLRQGEKPVLARLSALEHLSQRQMTSHAISQSTENIGRGGQIRTDDPLLPKQVTPFVEIC